jgi:heme-degrading monooxygenase HmoA
MTAPIPAGHTASIFRIDRFVVPAEALPIFMERLRFTQQTLDTVPGCKQNLVLQQDGNPGEFNIITLVEWNDADAMTAAKATMQAKYAAEGFDPAAFIQKLGVQADMGVYRDA